MLITHPRIKSIYPIYRVTDDLFRIGAQRGITAQFNDPEDQAWTIIKLMDGLTCVEDITERMISLFPKLTEQDVLGGIERLDQAGLLESAELTAYDDSDSPLHRYVGNVNYFSRFLKLSDSRSAAQDRLRNSSIALLGLGGAGANVLKLLTGLGVGSIVAVDYDRVELSNLNRQFFYRESDIGRFKTEAASEIVAQANSTIKFRTVNKKLSSPEDVANVIRGADLVISTIDEPNFLALRRVNRACVNEKIPCIFGVMQVTRGRVFSVIPFESGCFDCLHVYYHKTDPLFVEQFRGFHESNFQHLHIAFGPDIFSLCGRVVNEAVRILVGHMAPTTHANQVEIDFETGQSSIVRSWPRYPEECPTCGTGNEEQWPAFSAYTEPL